jgi:transposase
MPIPKKKEMRAGILLLLSAGVKQAEIARRYDITRQRVSKLANEAKKPGFLGSRSTMFDAVRAFVSGKPDGSWTMEQLIDSIDIEFTNEYDRNDSIRRALRKLGYVPRWVQAKYIGVAAPEYVDAQPALSEAIEIAKAQIAAKAAAEAKPEPAHDAVVEAEVIDEPKQQVTSLDWMAAAIADGRVPLPESSPEPEPLDALDEIGF